MYILSNELYYVSLAHTDIAYRICGSTIQLRPADSYTADSKAHHRIMKASIRTCGSLVFGIAN